jgi:hypothetical protein
MASNTSRECFGVLGPLPSAGGSIYVFDVSFSLYIHAPQPIVSPTLVVIGGPLRWQLVSPTGSCRFARR